MKKFRFKFTKLTFIFLILTVLISVAGVAFNALNLANLLKTPHFFRGKIFGSVVFLIIAVLIGVLGVAVLVFSFYTVKKENVVLNFGFIKTQFNINEITNITHFKKSNRLVAYLKEQKYTVINVNPTEYENFILAVREINSSILYEKKIDGEEAP